MTVTGLKEGGSEACDLATSLFAWANLLPSGNVGPSPLFVVHWLGLHAHFDLRRHGGESLFNIGGVLGTGLEELDADVLSEFLGLFRGHLPAALLVTLVAHQQLVDVLARVSVNLVQPLLHVLE